MNIYDTKFWIWFDWEVGYGVSRLYDISYLILSVAASAASVYVLIKACKMILQNIRGQK